MHNSVREILDEIKFMLNIKTDQELAESLGVGYHAMVAWLQRDKIPDKWIKIIKNKSNINNGNNFIGINNGHISFSTSSFNHEEDIKKIITKLKFAPSQFLTNLLIKLEEFEKMSDI